MDYSPYTITLFLGKWAWCLEMNGMAYEKSFLLGVSIMRMALGVKGKGATIGGYYGSGKFEYGYLERLKEAISKKFERFPAWTGWFHLLFGPVYPRSPQEALSNQALKDRSHHFQRGHNPGSGPGYWPDSR